MLGNVCFNRICAPFTLSTLPQYCWHVRASVGFNRICAPFTLSTRRCSEIAQIREQFQSHLRPIHPIHLIFTMQGVRASYSFNRICAPFTLSTMAHAATWQRVHSSFNRICAPFTLSTRKYLQDSLHTSRFQSHLRPIHPIHKECAIPIDVIDRWFQSHLRPIHPIHCYGSLFLCFKMQVSIASAPHSPYPLAGKRCCEL